MSALWRPGTNVHHNQQTPFHNHPPIKKVSPSPPLVQKRRDAATCLRARSLHHKLTQCCTTSSHNAARRAQRMLGRSLRIFSGARPCLVPLPRCESSHQRMLLRASPHVKPGGGTPDPPPASKAALTDSRPVMTPTRRNGSVEKCRGVW